MFAASRSKNNFAMVPVINGQIHGALAFESSEEANRFLKDFENQIGPEEYESKIKVLRPRVIGISPTH